VGACQAPGGATRIAGGRIGRGPGLREGRVGRGRPGERMLARVVAEGAAGRADTCVIAPLGKMPARRASIAS